MSAVPIYVWNGTAWQETGPTIPASPIKYQASAPSSPSTGDIWVDSDADVTSGSQQFQRFRFVASGGETTISGADANGAVLAYTAGAELVVLNGSTLVRGQDYTATNGTSITGLSPALVANDVLEVFSFIAFSVANTYTQSQVDGLLTYKGVVLKNNGTQTCANDTYTYITFNTENIDTNGFHSTSTNTDRITIPAGMGGKYLVQAQVRMAANTTGYRRFDIELGATGASLATSIVAPVNGSATTGTLGSVFELAAGDYIRLSVYQNSGGNLDTVTGSTGNGLSSTFLSATYLGV
jgi:hypothetical protein